MASIAYLLDDAYNIYVDIKKREDEAEEARCTEYLAARTIQRWVRGFLVRQYIKWLHSQATIIQKHWRGYLGRIRYLQVLKERVDEMCWNYYNAMATRIQKMWRGYYVRTKLFNIKNYRAWKMQIVAMNEKMMQDMQNFREGIRAYELEAAEKEALYSFLNILFKNHHLMRTYGIPGIYSKRNTVELSLIEEQMKAMKYIDYVKELHRKRLIQKQKRDDLSRKELLLKGHVGTQDKFWHQLDDPDRYDMQEQGEYINEADALKEYRRNKDLEVTRFKFTPIKDKDDDILYLEPKDPTGQHGSSNIILSKQSTTQIPQNKLFNLLPKCDCKPLSSTAMEFYTKVPSFTCTRELNK